MHEDLEAPLAKVAHGDDERISIQNLLYGTQALYRIVESFCASPG
jgi:hypothetical protein